MMSNDDATFFYYNDDRNYVVTFSLGWQKKYDLQSNYFHQLSSISASLFWSWLWNRKIVKFCNLLSMVVSDLKSICLLNFVVAFMHCMLRLKPDKYFKIRRWFTNALKDPLPKSSGGWLILDLGKIHACTVGYCKSPRHPWKALLICIFGYVFPLNVYCC